MLIMDVRGESPTAVESALGHERAFVVAGLVGVSLIAWVYLISEAETFHREGVGLPRMELWSPGDFVLVFLMWSIMMVAMMVPSASPMVLTYATIRRKQHPDEGAFGATGAFLLGYVILWTAFSALATAAQWGLQRAALISSAGESTNAVFAGGLLLVAGIFQWTPWKRACLTRCRSPFLFIMTSWRDGTRGALMMGLEHGVFCLGCCWALMALMFLAGVMNIFWLVALSLFVLVEKVVPAGDLVGRLAGAGMMGWGLFLIRLGI